MTEQHASTAATPSLSKSEAPSGAAAVDSGSGPQQALEIELKGLTKHFRGTKEPAVDHVDMVIPAGETVVFVGPSGCGKTTTMRMINRLIEPTSGEILLGGEDVLKRQPDELRRHIGYVIQQVGLLPHLTVADNVALVPGLLKWDKKRTRARTEELLELVGLPPAEFASRYPRQLSGGQQQRVGVARAMAADPPVLLMDEPFGAVDPITRDRLQAELVNIQRRVKKTIVFVTHDIDEAMKLGDRVAILAEQSRIAQYDTPNAILANPAEDYVSRFIGGGAAVRRLHLVRTEDADLLPWTTGGFGDDAAGLAERARRDGNDWVLFLEDGRPVRWYRSRELEAGERPSPQGGHPVDTTVTGTATLHDAMDEMLTSGTGAAIVVDDRGAYRGVLTLEQIVATLRTTSTGAEA